jgi:hypothetical protein
VGKIEIGMQNVERFAGHYERLLGFPDIQRLDSITTRSFTMQREKKHKVVERSTGKIETSGN